LTRVTRPHAVDADAYALRDQRVLAVWMGAVRPLKLSLFGGEDQA